MAISEIFAMIAIYEYAYSAAPRSARSLFMSLRFCSLGISTLIGAGYTAIFSPDSLKLDFSVCIELKNSLSLFNVFYTIFLVFK
jgi:hypothetical protein